MVRELKGPLDGSLIRRHLGGILAGRGDLLPGWRVSLMPQYFWVG